MENKEELLKQVSEGRVENEHGYSLGLMKRVDNATREETSGNFYSYDGTPLSF